MFIFIYHIYMFKYLHSIYMPFPALDAGSANKKKSLHALYLQLTVDGQNPAPPGMVKTLLIMG